MIDVIRHKWIFLGFSLTIVVLSIVAIIVFGFRPAVDFTGGTIWHVRVADPTVSEEGIASAIQSQGAERPLVYRELSTNSFFIKTKPLSEDQHQQFLSGLFQKYSGVEELKFESVGPTIGKQLRTKAIWAGVLVLLAISLYVAISFRKVSYPVASWKYGVITLITLFHDVVIPAGLLAVLGAYRGVEIDTNFIVALLVIIGFSVHDTIVVFDRVRENVLLKKSGDSFDQVVQSSIAQTMLRSINTSLTLVLMLVAMLLFGSPTLKLFVTIILVGTICGTYSSIFVASPLLTVWNRFSNIKSRKG